MAFGTCKNCKREVTVGSDRCALCGELLPKLDIGLPGIQVDPPGPNLPEPGFSRIRTQQLSASDIISAAKQHSRTAAEKPDGGQTSRKQRAFVGRLPQTIALRASDLQPKEGPAAKKKRDLEVGWNDDLRQTLGEKPSSFDMRSILRGDSSPQLGQPRAPQKRQPTNQDPAVNSKLSETDIEGFSPVAVNRGVNQTTRKNTRRQTMTRAIPLCAILFVAILGIVVAARSLAPERPSSNDEDLDLNARVLLAEGTFLIGLNEDNRSSVMAACYRLSDNPNHECRRSYLEEVGEYPARQLSMPAFSMDRYEVSNFRYEECVRAQICPERDLELCQLHTHRGYQLNQSIPRRMLASNYPAICLTREDAQTFCAWEGGRLPSPSEWERAARGGDERLAPWGNLWASNLINWAETDMGGFPVVGRLDGFDLTAPVNRFSDGASPEGLYNMLGNVSEWVAPEVGLVDGVRGSSYRDDIKNMRVTYHRPMRPELRRSDIGFRCLYEVSGTHPP